MSDDFYEDDEPIKDVQAAYAQGAKGVTRAPRDLNQRAASIVERATGSITASDEAGNVFVSNRIVRPANYSGTLPLPGASASGRPRRWPRASRIIPGRSPS